MRAQSAATRGRVHLEDRRERRARAVSRGGRARLLDLRLLGLSRAPAVTSEDRGETGELGAFDQVEGGGEDALGAVEARVPREAVDGGHTGPTSAPRAAALRTAWEYRA